MPSYLTSIKTVSYFFLRLAGRFGSSAVSVTTGVSATTGASSTTTGACSTTTGACSTTGAVTGTWFSDALWLNHTGSAETFASGAVSTPLTFPRFLTQLLFLYHGSKLRYLK